MEYLSEILVGPKLRVQAWAGMIQRPAPPGDPKFLKVIIHNVGTQPTTLTNHGFFQYATKHDRKHHKPQIVAVLDEYKGAKYPYKLEVGTEAQLLMQQNASFETMLEKGSLYFGSNILLQNILSKFRLSIQNLRRRTQLRQVESSSLENLDSA